MDLKLVLHRTSIKSGKRSRVKNQSFKKDKFDTTAKFSTSLKFSIYRDEDSKNISTHFTHIYTYVKRPNTLCLNVEFKSINNLENSFNCFILEFSSVLEKQSLFCFALYYEYL